MSDLRKRLEQRIPTHAPKELAIETALSVLTEGIEIVTPHAEPGMGLCERDMYVRGMAIRCNRCPFEARIPESLLVELVEAAEKR